MSVTNKRHSAAKLLNDVKNDAAAPVCENSVEKVRSSYFEGACCWGDKQEVKG